MQVQPAGDRHADDDPDGRPHTEDRHGPSAQVLLKEVRQQGDGRGQLGRLAERQHHAAEQQVPDILGETCERGCQTEHHQSP